MNSQQKKENQVSCAFPKAMFTYLSKKRSLRVGKQTLNQIIANANLSKDYGWDHLNNRNEKMSLSDNRKLAEAIETHFVSPGIMYEIGLNSSQADIYGGVKSLFMGFPSTKQAIGAAPHINKDEFFNNCMPIEITDLKNNGARIQLKYTNGAEKEIGKCNCDFQKGMFSSLPTLKGMPPAKIREEKCAVDLESILKREKINYEIEKDKITEYGMILAEKTKEGFVIVKEKVGSDGRIILPRGKIYNYKNENGEPLCEYEMSWINPTTKRLIFSFGGAAGGIGVTGLLSMLPESNQIQATVLPIISTIAGYYIGKGLDLQKSHKELSESQEELLKSTQIALRETRRAKSDLEIQKEEIKKIQREELDNLENMLNIKDPYTRDHSNRTGYYAVKIAEKTNGLSKETIERIYEAARFHDIGKIYIEESILKGRKKLSDEEYKQMKKHPTYTKMIFDPLVVSGSIDEETVRYMYEHHERIDGKGYPQGITGEKISIGGRILGVVDAYDAMTSDRSYRKAMPERTALLELIKGRGSQFDPSFVDCFIRIQYQEGRIDDVLLDEIKKETGFELKLK